MFEDAVGWWQQWEGVYLGFWKWFAFFSRTTCQINLDECCKCSEILLEMNSTVVTLDCFSLYGNLMHIASAVYFHFSDALNAKKKKEAKNNTQLFIGCCCENMNWSYCVLKWSQELECHKNTGLLYMQHNSGGPSSSPAASPDEMLSV